MMKLNLSVLILFVAFINYAQATKEEPNRRFPREILTQDYFRARGPHCEDWDDRCGKLSERCLKVYEHIDFEGDIICVYVNDGLDDADGRACQDIPRNGDFGRLYAEGVSSVKTPESCLILFSEKNCQGYQFKLDAETWKEKNRLRYFNDMAKSVRSCVEPGEIDHTVPGWCWPKDLQLFIKSESSYFHQPVDAKEDDQTAFDVITAATSIFEIGIGGRFMASVNLALGYVGELIKSGSRIDKDNKLLKSQIDAEIIRSECLDAATEIEHCRNTFRNFNNSRDVRDYKFDIEYCFHRMVTVMKKFDKGIHAENIFISSPYLAAFAPLLIVVQTLTLNVNHDRVSQAKEATDDLVKILESYSQQCASTRVDQVDWEKSLTNGGRREWNNGFYDKVIGATLLDRYEYGPHGGESVRHCKRNFRMMSAELCTKYFNKALIDTRDFRRKLDGLHGL